MPNNWKLCLLIIWIIWSTNPASASVLEEVPQPAWRQSEAPVLEHGQQAKHGGEKKKSESRDKFCPTVKIWDQTAPNNNHHTSYRTRRKKILVVLMNHISNNLNSVINTCSVQMPAPIRYIANNAIHQTKPDIFSEIKWNAYLLHGDLWLGGHVLLGVAHSGSVFVLGHGTHWGSSGWGTGWALTEGLGGWGEDREKHIRIKSMMW